jgi:hypothetical protein
MGFVLEPDEATELIAQNPKNSDVVLPFLTGQDLNARVDQSASRWTIYFFDWPLNRDTAPVGYRGPTASDYPECLRIVEQRVKPERLSYPPDSSWNRSIRERWWLYGLPRPALIRAMKGMERVLVRSAVSNLNCFAFGSTKWVFSHVTKVFIFDDFGSFGLLQSSIHTVWLEEYASRMKMDIRYTPETCFDTLAFPLSLNGVMDIGKRYYDVRSQMMTDRNEGLTKLYNRFNTRHEDQKDILSLRSLRSQLDYAIAAAYGWTDLDLGHGFHETKQGIRYTIAEAARREVLDRLLALNHERYAQEQAKLSAEPRAKRRGRKRTAAQSGLF